MRKNLIFSIAFGLAASAAMAAGLAPFQKSTGVRGVRDNVINPERSLNKVIKKVTPEGTVLYEDFEEWDGTTQPWQPEGWTFNHVKSPAEEIEPGVPHPGWRVIPADPMDPFFYPSKTYIYYPYSTPVDEWLISPEFTVGDDMIFMADCFNSAIYYFDYEVVDVFFDHTFTKCEKISDFIIEITTDDGLTWTPLYSIADEILNSGIDQSHEVAALMGWETIAIDLKDYAGATAKIGFHIVGAENGQASGVDNIIVGYPKIDVAYQRPKGALFYGIMHPDVIYPASCMVVPVHSPVTYPNVSQNAFNVNYSWTYDHSDGELTSDDESLVVTYRTNHETEKTSRNNIYNMPVLTGSGDKHTSASFSQLGWVQAGGKGESYLEIVEDDGSKYGLWIDLGLLNACPAETSEGTSTYADITTPYFGYNNENDRYWTIYEFPDMRFKPWNGLPEQDWAKLERIGNVFYTSDAPIVIDGIRLPAYGRGFAAGGTFSSALELKAEIYLLGDDMKFPKTPAYTSVCKGNQIECYDRYATNFVLSCYFPFEEPLVLSSADAKAFLVAITGFNNPDHVDYFSPEMTAYDNPDGLELGWYQLRINWGGDEVIEWHSVFEHMSNTDSFGKFPEFEGERKRTFCTILDAAYPWLECEQTEVSLSGSTPATVALDSYYDGSKLKVENLPSWLKAEVSGRYGATTLKLTATGIADDQAEINITAPGVSKKLIVKSGDQDGVFDFVTDADGPVEYFNLQGIKVYNPLPGQILIKRQGDNAELIAF